MKTNTIALVLTLSASLTGQQSAGMPTSPAFEQAVVVEEFEHDLAAASTAYRDIAENASVPDALRRRAWLRLGRMQIGQGDVEAGKKSLGLAAADGDDAVSRAAATLLQDPSPDEKRRRAIAKKARELALAFLEQGDKAILSQLRWLGPDAVPGIEALIYERTDTHGWSDLLKLLWSLGGPHAVKVVNDLRNGESEEIRHCLAQTSFVAERPEMVAIAQSFLSHPDDQTVRLVLSSSEVVAKFDLDLLIGVLDRDNVELRVRIYRELLGNWSTLQHVGSRAATARRLVAPLQRDMDAVDPRLCEQAQFFLRQVAVESEETLNLYIETLPRLKSKRLGSLPGLDISGLEGMVLAEPLREALLAAKTADDDEVVEQLVGLYGLLKSGWDRRALPTMLEFAKAEAGCDDVLRVAQAEDAVAVYEALRQAGALLRAMAWVARLDAAPQALAPLIKQDVVAAKEEGRDWLRGAGPALAATRNPSVPAFLGSQFARGMSANELFGILGGLLDYSVHDAGESARVALMRCVETFASEGDGGGASDGDREVSRIAATALARLMQLGDVRALPYLTRYSNVSIGPSFFPAELVPEGVAGQVAIHELFARGVNVPKKQSYVVWHGYDSAGCAAAWTSLLKPEAPGIYRKEFYVSAMSAIAVPNHGMAVVPKNYSGGVMVAGKFRKVDPTVLGALVKAWVGRIEDPVLHVVDNDEQQVLSSLIQLERGGLVEDAELADQIRGLRALCRASRQGNVRQVGIALMPEVLTPEQRAEVVSFLGDPNGAVATTAMGVLRQSPGPVGLSELEQALKSGDSGVRQQAVSGLASRIAGDPMPGIRQALTDQSVGVRVAACVFLGARMELDSAEPLMGMLRDESPKVREAAKESLTSIRFYFEQRAHWARVYDGRPDVSANGAAEALIAQAAGDQPKAKRLLAIRSLGQLGVAETLPTLIDFTESKDAEIRAAASEAIGRIHAASK